MSNHNRVGSVTSPSARWQMAQIRALRPGEPGETGVVDAPQKSGKSQVGDGRIAATGHLAPMRKPGADIGTPQPRARNVEVMANAIAGEVATHNHYHYDADLKPRLARHIRSLDALRVAFVEAMKDRHFGH